MCSIIYSSSPVAYLKRITCSRTYCTHVTSLKLEIKSCADDGDSPLAVFVMICLCQQSPGIITNTLLCDFTIPVYISSIEGTVCNPLTELCSSKDGICECGSPWHDCEYSTWVVAIQPCHVLLHGVYFHPCSSCVKKCYDGKDDKLVDLGMHAFGYNIFHEYLNHFLTPAPPMYHYCKTLMYNYVRKGAEKALADLH